jgi:nitrate reductase gamma subunit
MVGKITILYSAGFLVIYIIFVIVVIVTNRNTNEASVPNDNSRKASIFLGAAAN